MEEKRAKEFTCYNCGSTFPTSSNRARHIKNVCKVKVKTVMTVKSSPVFRHYCGASFATKFNLDRHVANKSCRRAKPLVYKCSCGKDYARKSHLKRHQKRKNHAEQREENMFSDEEEEEVEIPMLPRGTLANISKYVDSILTEFVPGSPEPQEALQLPSVLTFNLEAHVREEA